MDFYFSHGYHTSGANYERIRLLYTIKGRQFKPKTIKNIFKCDCEVFIIFSDK